MNQPPSYRLALLACLLWALLAALPPPSVQAQSPSQPLRIATRVVPPFVEQDKGELTGFSIDLWKAIADDLKIPSTFTVKSSVGDLLTEVQTGKADAGIAAVSITSERDKVLDFSQPMFNSGLQILTPGQAGAAASPIRGLFSLLFSSAMLEWLGIALTLIIVPAHILWLLERNHSESMLPSKAYFPGIFHALWWSAGTLATQADQMPRSTLARILAVLWMFTGVVFVAYFTAQVTASLTVQQLQGNIKGPDDLPGKRIATTSGSTSAAYLRENKSTPVEFPRIEDAYTALLNGQADAVVFDAPVLLYYSSHDGKGKVQMVGEVFRKEDYGIVFPPNSPYRKPINLALLKLRENGTYQKIYDKWFANP